MRIILTLCVVLALSACSSMGSKETRVTHEVACGGFELWPDCDKKARRVCEGGEYDVKYREESQVQQKRLLSFYCK